KNVLKYYNLTERIDEIGLDFQKDTYDAGIHLNLSGSRKLSSYFAGLLSREFELTDYRTIDEVNKGYIEKIDEYEKIIKENGEAMEK
ncbi:MAG: SGNH/GDSL hydrolase family protein, partial [Clostridia bacterium]|nr:SGNH/GDSL hydrolase family protein [Clostridia bacterium]